MKTSIKGFTKLFLFFFLSVFIYQGASASQTVNAYLFWGEGCPHCEQKKNFLSNLKKKYPSLIIKDFEINKNSNNTALFKKAIDKFKITNIGVPLLIIGDKYFIGYSSTISPTAIETTVRECTQNNCVDAIFLTNPTPDQNDKAALTARVIHQNISAKKEITLPLFGTVQLTKAFLPTFTIIMGILDGFNPCAMWVLVFLIGLLLDMENKRRRWILGSVFIFVSGFIYYLFMAAWLNFIMFVSMVTWIRIVIGTVAIATGGYSLKEFIFKEYTTCKVTGGTDKKETFQKLKKIIHEHSFILALIGISVLAITVNIVELACSAGLPATFVQVLLLNNLPTWQYYSYIALYIFFFMLDDLFVFFVAMIALEVTGLTTKYVKYSKLIGGILMVALGLLLVFKPGWLMF